MRPLRGVGARRATLEECHTGSLRIAQPLQRLLGLFVSLHGGLPVQLPRTVDVLGGSPSVLVHTPEIILCDHRALRGRFFVQLERLSKVPLNTQSVLVEMPEVVLRARLSLRGSLLVPLPRF